MMKKTVKRLFVIALMAGCAVMLGTVPQRAWASQGQQDQAMVEGSRAVVALSDEELGAVSAGTIELSLEGFDVAIQGNDAGLFTMDIAQSAFSQAQGVFTTLQAVNSAVDLTVVVNIFLGQPNQP